MKYTANLTLWYGNKLMPCDCLTVREIEWAVAVGSSVVFGALEYFIAPNSHQFADKNHYCPV
ncbi:MAG TPA: hypothetical protein VGN23_07265 [Verrucomicrobiae bacterium]